jgi:hypothetical protein
MPAADHLLLIMTTWVVGEMVPSSHISRAHAIFSAQPMRIYSNTLEWFIDLLIGHPAVLVIFGLHMVG